MLLITILCIVCAGTILCERNKFSFQTTIVTTSPPIYVINLKRNPERRLYMRRQLDAHGLKYEFVDVDDIDKYELKSKAYRMWIAQSFGIDESLLESKYALMIEHPKVKRWKNENLGQLAIILSHVRIYDLMVNNGVEWACILEDDATLLPTFPEILKIAPKLEWDILLLASHSAVIPESLRQKKSVKKRIHTFYHRCLLFLSRRVNQSNILKQKAHQVKNLLEKHDIDPFRIYRIAQHRKALKRLLEEYGIDPHIYPNHSDRASKILEEHNLKFEKIRKEYEAVGRTILNHGPLNLHTSSRLGALPEKTSLELISKHHCIAKPRICPWLAAAYLVNQSAAMKWKHLVLANNALAIDQVPWELYKNGQVKLRIITPPCATNTYHYIVNSARRHYTL